MLRELVGQGRLETAEFPTFDKDKIAYFTIEYNPVKHGLLTKLAFDTYGNATYWWIIAVFNDLNSPLCIPVGKELDIPTDLNQILDYF